MAQHTHANGGIWCECLPKIFAGNMFFCVLGRLSSCDHLDLEKSPGVRKTDSTIPGSSYAGGYVRHGISACNKLNQIHVVCYHPAVRPPELIPHFKSELNMFFFFFLPFLFPFLLFRSMALAGNCQEETPQAC